MLCLTEFHVEELTQYFVGRECNNHETLNNTA
jgi:hypothetical protein